MTVEREEKDIWCIWTKKGHRPKKFHETRDAAETEARRLATENPGKKFIVMHMESKWSTEADEIPPHLQPKLYPMGNTVVFFRKEGFYPVELSGKRPASDEVQDHVKLNPGTIRVEDLTGNELWPAST